MKLSLLLMLCVLLMSSRCATRYSAPYVEDCFVLVKTDMANETSLATCFCVDKNLKSISPLVAKVKEQMKGHYELDETLQYIADNEKNIIENKEYEFHIQYCRGYEAIGPSGVEALTIWAEKNRVERIKCENDLEF